MISDGSSRCKCVRKPCFIAISFGKNAPKSILVLPIMMRKTMKDSEVLKRLFQSKDPYITNLCSLLCTLLMMPSILVTALECVYVK